MHIDVSGKVVVITGAGRGIGECLARRFGQERARVAVLDRDAAAATRVAAEMASDGVEVLALTADVSVEADVDRAITAVVEQFGGIDVLINNAGIAPEAVVAEMSVKDWDETFAINTRGVFLCARAVIPHLKRAPAGRILSASSFAAVIPSVGFAAYSASKAAVVSFTRVLAAELGPWGITVNCYTPGMIPTPLNNFADAPPATRDRLLNTLSLRRWGSPDDIASLLVFLASDHAAYITASDVEISGGKYAVQFPHLAYERAR